MFKKIVKHTVVQEGETITMVSERTGVSPEDISMLNGIPNHANTRMARGGVILLEEVPCPDFDVHGIPLPATGGVGQQYEVSCGGFSALLTRSLTDNTWSTRFMNTNIPVSGRLGYEFYTDAEEYAKTILEQMVRIRYRDAYVTMLEYQEEMKDQGII